MKDKMKLVVDVYRKEAEESFNDDKSYEKVQLWCSVLATLDILNERYEELLKEEEGK